MAQGQRPRPHARGRRLTPAPPHAPGALLPLARALVDFRRGARDAGVRVVPEVGEPLWLPVAHLFRPLDGLSSSGDLGPLDDIASRNDIGLLDDIGLLNDIALLDVVALDRCRGRVLDVGACAGPHALALQARGLDVTAIDVLPEAVDIMVDRGVSDARVASWDDPELLEAGPYDVVLALMNGTGLSGTLAGFDAFLGRVGELLAPAGRLLVDSTDPLQHAAARGEGGWVGDEGRYPGEVHMQLEYAGERGDPFPHLFVDPGTLVERVAAVGLTAEVVARAPEGAYLAEVLKPTAT